MGMVQTTCVGCGISFQAKPACPTRPLRKYCSRACRDAVQNVPCECGTCGARFRMARSKVALGEGKFCSRACAATAKRRQPPELAGNWRGGQVACVCLNCGNEFFVDPNRVKAGRGKHCSKKCYWERARGEKHWHYKHGRGLFPYTGGYTTSVREAVIARDKACVDCGQWDDRPRCMQVHHKDGGRDDHALENLELLCVRCHYARHRLSHMGRHQTASRASNSSGQS